MKQSIGAKPILFPVPVFIVGSYDSEGKPNIMNVAWGGICCSEPPCLSISLRKTRYTYENIMRTRAFTVNIPSASQVREADYVGIYSGRDEDKFAATGLTPVKSDRVNAPYVKEFPLIVECQLIHTHEIGIHTQLIGQILEVKADQEVLTDKGVPDVSKIRPISFAPGVMGYYGIGEFLGKAFSIGKKE